MNKFIYILLALILSCKSPSQKGSEKSENKITELSKAFSNQKADAFLENFPKDFSTFKSTFGWNESSNSAKPLYNDYQKYIDYWFNLISNPQYKDHENEIILISKNGHWEADAINYFKEKSLKYIKANNKYKLINSLTNKDAISVISFLLDSPHPKYDTLFISGLNTENQIIAKKFLSKNISNEKQRSSLTTYLNNNNYFIRTFDVNKDGIEDKIVSSKPYQGEDLFIFLGNSQKEYKLSLEGYNFNEDGGNIIDDIVPIFNSKGIMIKTYFPGIGSYEKEYYILPVNQNWILRNIIYKTTSDNSENAVKYICDVFQNIDITKSGWMDKINEIPDENERRKKCKTEAIIKDKKTYSIQDPDGYTNLRKDKSTSSEILQQIKSGESIDVLENQGDWWLVKTSQGKQGYVHKSRVKAN